MTNEEQGLLVTIAADLKNLVRVIMPQEDVEKGAFVTKRACAEERGKPYRKLVWLAVAAIIVAIGTVIIGQVSNGSATAEVRQLRTEIEKMNGHK